MLDMTEYARKACGIDIGKNKLDIIKEYAERKGINRLTYQTSFGDYGYNQVTDMNSDTIKNYIGMLEDLLEV